MKRHLRTIFLIALAILLQQQAWTQWSTFAPMPTARWGINCVAEGGKLYVISGNAVTNNEAYTPGTNTWQSLAPIPTPTAYAQTASYNGKIYVLGGTNASAWLTTNQIYDIATNTWSTGAPLLSGRMGGTAVQYNGRIYLATGWNGALMNTLHIYDIATDSWSLGANSPTARYQTRGGLINGQMYVAGGYTSTWVGTNEAYDIATNTWTTRAAMPLARYIHAGGSDGALLHMVAGYNGAATNSYQTYNPLSNAWTTMPNAPTARYRVDGAVLNGCMYVAGGFNGSTLATLEGFCGLVVLPDPAVNLQLQAFDSHIRLDWSPLREHEAKDFFVERSIDAGPFEAIGAVNRDAAPTFADFDLLGQSLAYRLAWHDYNGERHYSNVALHFLQPVAEGYFQYAAASHLLRFDPQLPFPIAQGRGSLWDMQGRVLRQEDQAGPLTWDLTDLPAGLYVFRWEGAGKSFARKLIR